MFKDLINFLLLDFRRSFFILLGSILSGILQTSAIFTLFPLMYILDYYQPDDNNYIFLNFIKFIEFFNINLTITNVLSFLFLSVTLIAFIQYLLKMYAAKTAARIVRKLRNHLVSDIIAAKWSYFINKKNGEIVTSIISETGKTTGGYIDSISFISSILQCLVILISTSFISIEIFVLSIIGGCINFIIFSNAYKKSRQNSEKIKNLTRDISNKILDLLKGIKPLIAMNKKFEIFNNLSKRFYELENKEFQTTKIQSVVQYGREPIGVLVIISAFYINLNYELVSNAEIIPLFFLFFRTIQKFNESQTHFIAMHRAKPFFNAFFSNLHQAQQSKEINNGKYIFKFDDNIIFKDVSFKYKERIIFNNINLEIKKSNFIGIIGPSGSGKTTLIDLLCGLHQNFSGKILIDNINNKDIDLVSWRKNIGYVPQDPYFINDTIKNNIIFTNPEFSKNDLENAIILSSCEEFINSFEEREHFNVGEGGSKLSGGQRKRVSLARALIHNPQIIILDEPTAGLDHHAEFSILKILKNLTKLNKTIIFISHNKIIEDFSDIIFKVEDNNVEKIK